MTIKAIRADGSVIQDYKGNVVLNVENTKTTFDYDLPNGGFYQFTAQDQGIKTFSK
jgi:hypothetical protein